MGWHLPSSCLSQHPMMNLKTQVRHHRSARTPSTSPDLQAALPFMWPITERIQPCPSSPGGRLISVWQQWDPQWHLECQDAPQTFCHFAYKGPVFYQAPSESSPEDKTKYKSFIWELIWEAAIEDRGKEIWERKAADKRHVIKLARVEAVGQWSSSLLGSSGRWDRTHHRVFPDKEPASGSICPPTLISHCGRMMEVGGDGGINSGISGWLLVWTRQVSTVRENL